ncbi:hypothetical protein [Lacticaseibacillus porcinae]|uniref:hypothetical protein n=1 Tax=Lacticaseibacillus porcinae TaxID=1123687 RepID=UPI000F7789D7|nr:hypothetical protein [Lacticaseibacillus porcinae]
MIKKMLALSLLVVLAGCSDKPQSTPTPPKIKPAVHRVVFSREFQHMWYQVDAQGSAHTLHFSNNAVTYDGVKTLTYWASERNKDDNQILDAGQQPETKRAQWAAATIRGSWLNLRGWYQQTGSGTSYQVHGQQLWVASGAQPTVVAHFYRNLTFAKSHPEQKGETP